MSTEMTTSPMFAELDAIPEGEYNMNRVKWWEFWKPRERGGWLTVDKGKDGSTNIMWTSHRTSHDPFGGRALSITIQKGQLRCYMTSALTFHIRWGYGRGSEYELDEALEFSEWAHSRLCPALDIN